MAKFADSLTTLGLVLLGLVLMVTPLALWVAWTEAILIIVLAIGAAAAALYCLLVRFERPADTAQSESADHGRVEKLPDNTVEELQGLHPFIHHNRLSGGPKFRAVMDRLRMRLYRGPD